MRLAGLTASLGFGLFPCLALAACSPSPSTTTSSACQIPSATYTFTTTASGGPDCTGDTYVAAWPPTIPTGDAGALAEVCTSATPAGGAECQLSCAPPPGFTGASSTVKYTLGEDTFSGTIVSTVSGPDGGTAYTCTYAFVAAKN